MDIQAQLFETALGIEEPMFIEKTDFDQTIGELHIHINFRRGVDRKADLLFCSRHS